MKPRRSGTRSGGFTLTEMLVAFAVTTLVMAGVFQGMSHFLLINAQDEIHQNLRNDLLLTMGQICKDINLSTNVVSQAGTMTTDNTTLVLRQPVVGATEEIENDTFQYVIYTIRSGVSERGLLRQVWLAEDAEEPSESRILNDSIVALGFLFGGKPSTQVTNFHTIRDIEVILVSGRETGLRLASGDYNSTAEYSDLSILNSLLDYGLDFSSLRNYIDYMNGERVDVTIAATMGASTFRNKKALGIKTTSAPTS
ncbi:MAG: hypothetical protein GHCLOJNM_02772 [bacterium]|nr:hypothetical protein [bacterium]